MPEDQPILMSCGACGLTFGRARDVEAAQMDAHYQECTDWTNGEGLLKERPIRFTYEGQDD